MFGAQLVHASEPVHGKTSRINHDGQGIFRGLPQPMQVMRYHSLLLADRDLPESLSVTARTTNGEIMGIRHNFLNFTGVQFHPESILTEQGDLIVRNWMEMVDALAAKQEDNFKVIR
jgi:anthranilate synthase/aminodeoxychorismate synthase-like glutamine amidotransferase